MKYYGIRFKNMHLALKELEPFIRNGEHLQTGKPFKEFGGLRSRELLGNWLVCAVLNYEYKSERFIFTSDPDGGDGIVYDTADEDVFPTEHVLVPTTKHEPKRELESLILEKIKHKQAKGAPYGSGKTLIVFMNAGAGPWFPNRVARQLPSPLHFETVWVVGLSYVVVSRYVYGVTNLDFEQRECARARSAHCGRFQRLGSRPGPVTRGNSSLRAPL